MTSWSKRRKLVYAAISLAVVAGGIVGVFLIFFYRAPTCFDGRLNGGEAGIDCGGKCVRLCQSAYLAPSISWTKFVKIAPDLYNIATYIINPNPEGEALNVPYRMALYDDKGIIITDRTGVMNIPPHRNVLAFQGAIPTGSRRPAKAIFEFTALPDWHKKSDPLSSLEVVDKFYTEEIGNSSLIVTLANNGAGPLGSMTVYAVLSDRSGNVLDFSKTIVDGLSAKSKATAPFTWSQSHDGRVISIEVLPVAE